MKVSAPDYLNRIKQARDVFSEKGAIPAGLLPEPIERSWKRCLHGGLAMDARQNFDPLQRSTMEEYRQKNIALLSNAQPVMENLYDQILNTNSMVILTDADGLIIHSLGDPGFVSKARRVALQPGVSWDEGNKGTNAIGTSLAEQKPVLVHGSEHYMASNNFLTCSASPIFNPYGHLTGVLDVSGDYRSYQEHTLALVKMSVQMIENHLFVDEFPHCVSLHFHSRPEFIGTLCEGIAVFTPDGGFVSANRSGQFQLGLTLQHLQKQTFASLFDSSFDALVDQARHLPYSMLTLCMHNGVRVHARVQLGSTIRQPRAVAVAARYAEKPAPASTPREISETVGLDVLDLGDERVRAAMQKIRKVLGREIPILIQGETGTGKELFAKSIHEASARRHNPFVAVNCAAIPDGLIESELFGYEEGAFTGARRKGAVGKILQANGGTLFLDEIGDMPLNLQARLLRVLQERLVMPLGSVKSYAVDVAIICATNHNLRDQIANGGFREDLYYRLNGLLINLPPLRERSDLEQLVLRLVKIESGEVGQVKIADDVMELFRRHPWPGNIRQMHNLLRIAVAMLDDQQKIITRAQLPDDFLDEINQNGSRADTVRVEAGMGNLQSIEAEAIERAIAACSGNISAAARQLGISRNTLYRKLKPD
ncbi:MAG: sigma-54-dependent Fis family transcriptional regulator [Burkholderiales bacterium]